MSGLRDAYAASTSLADLAARLGCHYSTARKCAVADGLTIPAEHWGRKYPEPNAAPAPTPEESTAHDREVARLKADLAEVNAKYKVAVKEQVQREDVLKTISACAPVRPFKALSPRRRRVTKLPKREVVCQLSDWQLGEKVTADESGGNVYDGAVAKTRLDRWQDKVIRSIENQSRAYSIEYASLAFCGDIVEGHDVYSGQPWALDMDAGRQVVEGGGMFGAAVESVVTNLGDIEWSVYCVSGNHGKPGGRKAGHMPTTLNFDWMLYKWLERECANLPIKEFGIAPGGRLLFYQAGQVFLLTHGDEVRGWGGFPFYGLDKAQGRLVVDLETVFKYWLLGHWHQAASLPAGRGARIVNGNAVGPNSLSQAAVLGSATPEQNLLFVSDEFGVAEHAHIFLAPNEFEKPHIYGRVPA